MKDFGRGDEAHYELLSPHSWKGARSIGLAHQLNEQFIGLCCELALDAASGSQIPLVAAHRDLWSRLDQTSRKRLSLFPFVIVDLRFGDATWWHIASHKGAQARGLFAATVPEARWAWLALETLMFGWQVAREDRVVATMLFAMPPPVVDRIAALTMQQVRMLSVESAKIVRLRWDNDSRFWRELLIAARELDESKMEVLRREAELHFCGELIQASFSHNAVMPLIAEGRVDSAQKH